MTAPNPEQRLLSIAAFLLKQEDAVPWPRIREEFATFYSGSAEAAERKWTRDKQSLLEAGVPIEFVPAELGHEGGYVIRPEAFHLKDLRLSADEAAVVWTAATAAARMSAHPWRRHVVSACDKLRAACRALPAASDTLCIRHAEGSGGGEGTGRIVDRLGEAVRRRKRVQVAYFTASRGEVNVRDVDVYGFAWRRGVWLFVGHCHLRGELRVFYVDQVRELALNGKDPAVADYEIPASFDLSLFSRQQPWEFWFHEPLECEVRLEGSLAPLAEQLLPGVGAAYVRHGEVTTVRLGQVRYLAALVRRVLSLGPDAELVSPERGRELAREMLGQLSSRLHQQPRRSA